MKRLKLSRLSNAVSASFPMTKIRSFWKNLEYRLELLFLLLTRSEGEIEPKVRVSVGGRISPDHGRPVCIFSSYDDEDIVREIVYYYLQQLKMAGFDTVFVSTSSVLSELDLKKLTDLCIRIISRENKGYDFYSWKVGLEHYPQYCEHAGLLLANDSVYGPFFDFGDIIEKLQCNQADIIGLTDNYQYYPHLQSYFIYCKSPVFLSKEFRDFFDYVKVTSLKSTVIRQYEVGFAQRLSRQFEISALYPISNMYDQIRKLGYSEKDVDPTFRLWEELIIDFKFPFVKKSLMTRRKVGASEVVSILAKSGSNFDINLLTGFVGKPVDSIISHTETQKDLLSPAVPVKLSICIGTHNRAKFIGETLDSILAQQEPNVEIVIMDNASSDDTPELIAQYLLYHPEIRYFRKHENTGFDRNYDEVVMYAKGEYCWLMSDDDLLIPGAIANILDILESKNDLIVVNSEVRNSDLSFTLESRLIKLDFDRIYRREDRDTFFIKNAKYLSFIGCLVIRRAYWLSKNASSYYGTGFVHVGVLFQSPAIFNVRVMAKPSVVIRLGNSTWSDTRFDIWMIWWPKVIWSFIEFPEVVKKEICVREPWRRVHVLLKQRALGVYTRTEFDKVWKGSSDGIARILPYLLCNFPERWANLIVVFYSSLMGESKSRVLYDLLLSSHAGAPSHFIALILGKKTIVRSLRH
jgi:abequosyltransferase